MTSDPGMLQTRTRVVEEEKIQWSLSTRAQKHMHNKKDETHSTACKFPTARKHPIIETVISLVFYQLWHSPSFIPLNLRPAALQCLLSIADIQSDSHFTLVWRWRTNETVSWPLIKHFIALISLYASELNSLKGGFATTSLLHLFLVDSGYNLSPSQNIKRLVCAWCISHWIGVFASAFYVCPTSNKWVIHSMCNYTHTCLCVSIFSCVRGTAVITYSSLDFSYAVTVHYSILQHTAIRTHRVMKTFLIWEQHYPSWLIIAVVNWS